MTTWYVKDLANLYVDKGNVITIDVLDIDALYNLVDKLTKI